MAVNHPVSHTDTHTRMHAFFFSQCNVCECWICWVSVCLDADWCWLCICVCVCVCVCLHVVHTFRCSVSAGRPSDWCWVSPCWSQGQRGRWLQEGLVMLFLLQDEALSVGVSVRYEDLCVTKCTHEELWVTKSSDVASGGEVPISRLV